MRLAHPAIFADRSNSCGQRIRLAPCVSSFIGDPIMRPNSAHTSVRRPAVAGLFYPADAAELRTSVSEHLRQAPSPRAETPKALIVPHAGYVYSGGVAGRRTHSSPVAHASAPDRAARSESSGLPARRSRAAGSRVRDASRPRRNRPRAGGRLLARGDVVQSDQPHALEHSLEVQLPFLQSMFRDFTVLPLVLGDAPADYVASLLADVWGDADTLVLASSDLSHYHRYEIAQQLDAATSAAILRLHANLTATRRAAPSPSMACCGWRPKGASHRRDRAL